LYSTGAVVSHCAEVFVKCLSRLHMNMLMCISYTDFVMDIVGPL